MILWLTLKKKIYWLFNYLITRPNMKSREEEASW